MVAGGGLREGGGRSIITIARQRDWSFWTLRVAILWGFWWFGMNTIDVMRLCFQLLSNFPSWQVGLSGPRKAMKD